MVYGCRAQQWIADSLLRLEEGLFQPASPFDGHHPSRLARSCCVSAIIHRKSFERPDFGRLRSSQIHQQKTSKPFYSRSPTNARRGRTQSVAYPSVQPSFRSKDKGRVGWALGPCRSVSLCVATRSGSSYSNATELTGVFHIYFSDYSTVNTS